MFVAGMAVLLMLAYVNVALAAVSITGEVTPSDIDTDNDQPSVDLYVGSATNFGQLDIDGGSTVTVNGANVGYGTNDGTINIDGGNMVTNSDMTVGESGLGSLFLDNSSSLTVNGWLYLAGDYAGNTTTIMNGSTLTVTDTTSGLYIGGGANTVTFTASNSGTITVGKLEIHDNANVSFTGTSTLNITGDATFEGDYDVEFQQDVAIGGDMTVSGDSTSSLTVVGTGTTLDVGGTLTIDSTSGITVQNSAVVSTDVLEITSGSTLVVDDGVSSGAVVVGTGSAVNGSVVVASDGILRNSGTVEGQVEIENGGQIGNEGDDPNQITIASGYDFTLASGSTYVVNIDTTKSPANDNISIVSGNATLESGSVIKVVPVSLSQLSAGDTFDVITASSGTITDNGVTIEQASWASLFRYFTGSVVGGNVYQLLYTTSSFQTEAHGRNNVSVAAALDDMLNSGTATAAQTTMLDNLLSFTDNASFNNALHQMNAEIYTLHGRNLPNQMESFNRFISQHLTQMRSGKVAQLTAKADASMGMALASTEVDPETMAEVIESQKEQDQRQDAITDPDAVSSTDWSVWGQIINMWHKEKSSSRLTGYNNYSWGAVAGTDKEFAPGLRIGALIGYIRSDYHMKDSRGKLDVDTLRVGPYVDWTRGKMFVEAALTFGYHWNDAERKVNYTGFSDEDKADNYGAWDLTPYARVGYRFNVAGWDVTPSMAMQYVHYSQNGVTEHGGAAAMKVEDYDTNSLRQIFMVEVSKLFDLNYVKLVPALTLGYSYDYLDTGETLGSEFIGGYPCTFYPGGTSKGHVIWGASVTALLSDNLSLFVRYDGFAAGSDYSNALSSGVNYKF